MKGDGSAERGDTGAPTENIDVRRIHDCDGEAEHKDALTALVTEHMDFVWKILRRVGLSAARADDVTQEVFLVVVRRRGEIQPGRERSFLYGVALRLAANAQRQERRQREAPDDELLDLETQELAPDEAAARTQRLQRLDALLAQLPAKFRRVLVLSDVLELEVSEVASLERIPAGTVASRLRRARELFRKKLVSLTRMQPESEEL